MEKQAWFLIFYFMAYEAYLYLLSSIIQATAALMGIVAIVLIFMVDLKLAQAKKTLDELSIKYINSELNSTNVKRYMTVYVSKLHDSRLDPILFFILAYYYLLSSFIIIISILFLVFEHCSIESIYIFILSIVLIVVFLILVFQILNAPYSRIFNRWNVKYLLKQPQYLFISDFIGLFDLEDIEELFLILKKRKFKNIITSVKSTLKCRIESR